jgi:hypothetical protein
MFFDKSTKSVVYFDLQWNQMILTLILGFLVFCILIKFNVITDETNGVTFV